MEKPTLLPLRSARDHPKTRNGAGWRAVKVPQGPLPMPPPSIKSKDSSDSQNIFHLVLYILGFILELFVSWSYPSSEVKISTYPYFSWMISHNALEIEIYQICLIELNVKIEGHRKASMSVYRVPNTQWTHVYVTSLILIAFCKSSVTTVWDPERLNDLKSRARRQAVGLWSLTQHPQPYLGFPMSPVRGSEWKSEGRGGGWGIASCVCTVEVEIGMAMWGTVWEAEWLQ